jgi:hypothetical protein
MKTGKAEVTFTWYADHPKHGELILVIPCTYDYKYSYIYCPRIIRERMRNKMNGVMSMELHVGPLGFIPRQYYEEAGMMVLTPFNLRLLAMFDHHRQRFGIPDEHVAQHDQEICRFILEGWEKFTKEIDVK